MWQAMLAGVASLKAHQTRLTVIGNNVANLNTTAFKASRVQFEDLMFQTLRAASAPSNNIGGTNPMQIGLGVKIASLDPMPTQGSLQLTGRDTDLAIQGNGFFMVSDGDSIAYTRDGAFELDSGGTLVHRGTGRKIIGWQAGFDGTIDTAQSLGPTSFLQIPVGVLTAVRPTSRVLYGGNLDATASNSATWTTTVKVYDSLGKAHDIQVTFQNHQVPPQGTPPPGAVSSWEWVAKEGTRIVGAFNTLGNTRLYFDNQGKVVGTGIQTIQISPTNGAAPLTIQLDFTDLTQVASETEVQPTSQDGFPPGVLEKFNIGVDGTITGVFSNGVARALGRIALALFANPAGLERVGNNLWRESENSGLPLQGAPAQGGFGELNSGYLEMSNVDLGNEFSEMIIAQRGFQANTRIVTVVDELLQEVVNIKR